MQVRKLSRTPKAKVGFDVNFDHGTDPFDMIEWCLRELGRPDQTRWRTEWKRGNMGASDTMKFYFDDLGLAEIFEKAWC